MTYKRKSIALTILSIAGVAATGVFAAMRSPKYKELIEKDISKLKAFVIAYWPAITSGFATTVSIILAQKLSAAEIASLTAACSYLAFNKDKLEEKILDLVGTERLNEIKRDISKAWVAEQKEKLVYMRSAGPSVEETDRGDLLCLEGYSGRWFRSSEVAVNEAIKRFKQRFRDGEYVCLNDLYEELGIAKTHFGHQYGWAANPDYYDDDLDIAAEVLDQWVDDENDVRLDESLLVIDMYTYPMECWQEV